MNFNYDSGIINTVYTLDTTQTPPTTGTGVQNVLSILGGALSLPSSSTAVTAPQNGMLRYNTSGWLEFYLSSSWTQLASGSGISVSNVTNNSTYYPAFSTATTGSLGAIDVSSTTLTFNPGTNSGVLSTGQFVSTLSTGTAPLVISSTTQVANLQSQYATNLYGGVAGAVHYQTASNASGFTAAGTSNQLLQSNGTSAPSWTSTPVISGASINSSTIPNSALVNSSITIGTTSIALGATSTTLGGITGITFVSGTVTGIANPVNATDAVNLQYLQQVQSGLNWKVEVQAASTANLAATYSNGTSGVGATLTNSGAQAAFAIDGYTASLGDRILVKNQTTQTQNGIYSVTTVGTGSTNWVLTRTNDANTTQGLVDATVFIVQGSTNANTSYVQTTASPTIGTSNLVFAQNYGLTGYTAGTGISLTGNVFANTGVLSISGGTTGLTPSSPSTGAIVLSGTLGVGSGGTGSTVTPSNGALLIGNGTSYTSAQLSTGAGISVTAGSGTLTITNTLASTSQTASAVFIGPTTGSATPTFRTLVYGDIVGTSSSAIQLYSENASTPTLPSASGGTNSVAIGSGAITSAVNAIAVGSGSSGRIYGMSAFANGDFATAGDAQRGVYVVRAITTSSTANIPLYLDGAGASQSIVLPNNSLFTFDILVSARRTDATGTGGGWKFNGVIKKDTTAASTTLVGSVSETTIGSTSSSLAVTVSANTSTGALQVLVTGLASNTIRWVAVVTTCEVTN